MSTTKSSPIKKPAKAALPKVATLEIKAVSEKPYTFRRLKTTDVMSMVRIIRAIGINKFAECLKGDTITNAFNKATGGGGKDVDMVVGIAVMTEIAQVIIEGLDRCENDVYKLLADVGGMSVDEIKDIELGVFVEMVIDFVKKEEFADFVKAVSKLLPKVD